MSQFITNIFESLLETMLILRQCGDFEVSEATCGIMVNSNINI